MSPGRIWIIFKKELVEVLRDWRTVFVMLVLPIVLYPLLIVLVGGLGMHQARELQEEDSRIVILHPERAEPLVERLKETPRIQVVDMEEDRLEEALTSGEIHAAIRPGEHFQELFEGGTRGGLEIIYDGARDRSQMAYRKLRQILQQYREDVRESLLSEEGLGPAYQEPFTLRGHSISTGEEEGRALAAKFLPYLLIIMTLMGAIYPAVDLTAGEKERKTIETLLVSPASRTEIISGKFLTTYLISFTTATLNITAIGLTVALFVPMAELPGTIELTIGWEIGLAVLVIMLPLSALFTGLALAIATFAKTYREGMMYTTPLVIVCVLPAFITALPGINLNYTYALIPIVNASLLFKNLMVPPLVPGPIAISYLSTTIYAAGAASIAVYLFTREDLLLPDSEGFPLSLPFSFESGWIEPERGSATVSQMVLLLVALLLFVISLSALDGAIANRWIYLLQQGGFLFVPLAIGFLGLVDIRSAFLLRNSDLRGWAKGIATGILLVIASLFVANVLVYLVPALDWGREALQDFIQFRERSLVMLLLLFAVAPAICEEMVFRGFLLTGIRRLAGPFLTAAGTGLLFGLIHLVPVQVIAGTVSGFFLGLLALHSGSIGPPVLAHFLHNGLMITYKWLVVQNIIGVEETGEDRASELGQLPPALLIGGVIAIGLLSVMLVMYFEEKSSTTGESEA